ncbi:cytochrome P450 [Aspergillus minisclerotigenes]|uniref:Cytochrome P450 n=1 Tax=Aspergillus minisclerotigenes TaxID=656917 RepID=A0A5N6IU78_9EURO|nr:cytochrome P450 [Aspergillus minisclerotigenes]
MTIVTCYLGPSTLVGVIAALVSSYIIHQIWFHPLAQYPGPFLAKLTRFYTVYQAFRSNRHADLYNLHKRYGKIVRYGPNHISINDPQALEPIYGHQANVQKAKWYSSFFSVSIFNAIDKSVHARKRRVMSQAFSDQALRDMEPHVLSAIRDWCHALGDGTQENPCSSAVDGWSKPRDMAHWSACMVFDVLGEICFGKSFGTSSSDENHFFFPLMALNVRILNICGQMPVLRRIGVEGFLRRGTAADRKRQISFSRKQLMDRLAVDMKSTKRRDIVYFLQQARDPETGEGYSQAEMMGEATLLLGAGFDTANTALAATFYFLCKHPEVLTRLTSEIRNAFSDVESIVSGPSMQKMTYLRACLNESMRLCPPVPMDLPREVLPGGLRFMEHYFPAGTVVGVPTYSLHHNDAYFDEPFLYDPSRWFLRGSADLEGEGVSAETLSRQKEAFAPFSIGPRACIGRSIALMELEVGLARALWLYDMRLAPGMEQVGVGPEGEYKIRDNFIVGKEGPIVQFRKRL